MNGKSGDLPRRKKTAPTVDDCFYVCLERGVAEQSLVPLHRKPKPSRVASMILDKAPERANEPIQSCWTPS